MKAEPDDGMASLRRANAELLVERDEAQAQVAAMAKVLGVINGSSGELVPVFDTMLEEAMHICDAAFGMLVTYDGEKFRTAAVRGVPARYAEFRRSNPPSYGPGTSPARLLAGERRVHVIDLKAEDIYRAGEPNRRALVDLGGARTVLSVPLLKGGAMLGLFAIYRQEVRPFTEKQIALLENFAAQAVTALENARLLNETREALERQTATADILKVIASSPSDVQPVFEAIASSANRLIGGFSSTVFRFIDGVAHLKAFTPTTPEADEVLTSTFPRPVADFPPFQMAQAGKVAQIPDTEALSDEILNIARARGFRSMLFSPLMNNDESIGFVAVTRIQPGAFADHHVQLLQTFADQAVIAISNVGLFKEVQERTRDLSESLQQQTATADVLKVISRSTFDLQTVLETLIKSAVELSGANRGSIFLREGDVFPLKAASSTTPEFLQYWAANPPKAGRGSATSRVIGSGKVEMIPDVLEDPEMQMPASSLVRIRGTLGVPMLRDNKVEGVLVLTRPEPGTFTKSQIDLVQTFADQAVIAVENVRLFDETQSRTKELAASLEELRAAQDRLVQTEKLASLGQLTAGIAHEIKNPLNFVNNFSSLSAELVDELDETLAPAPLDQKMRGEVGELTQMLKSNLEKVVQHGKRADSIVKNMLLHSREGSGEHRAADINALVEESLSLAYHGARAEKPSFNITLKHDLDPDAGAVELYPQEITRALLNLIANGFYAATKRRSEAQDDSFEPVLSAATRNLGKTVEIRIRDNGTGIPPEVKEKMFNPFFTTKPAGEGTGLGLSMTHDIIVKQHGGRIDVETDPGVFTEFVITLPRDAAALLQTGSRK